MPDPLGFPRLGAHAHDDGTTTFCVWAPERTRAAVALAGEQRQLRPGRHGTFSARVRAAPGMDYRYVLDGDEPRPDPCSRCQPAGLRGPSRIVRIRAAGPRCPVALTELVIYELHIGTFSTAGTFDAAAERLDSLRDLGVTAIEVMPVATFPGHHGWGYDGVYGYAPHPAYGGPEGLARLIDAAHRAGLAVIMDVVYNHLGPGCEAVDALGPYRTGRFSTFWGEAMDYAHAGVREWAIQNAEMWIAEYGADGVRLDAVQAIVDERAPHIVAELTARVKSIDPRLLVIAETAIDDLRPIERWGCDAQWGDALHHAIHALLTGERDGYYADYGTLADLAAALERPRAERLVVCAQNHDQVGNRAHGDRLRGRDLRLAAFCAILSGGTPLLFQGEEYDESHPFQYFTDHQDPRIAELTREGRRREFARFAGFAAAEVADPQDPRTFARSKLDPAAGDPAHLARYRQLLALARTLAPGPPRVNVDAARGLLTIRRGSVRLLANFSEVERDGVPPRSGSVRSA